MYERFIQINQPKGNRTPENHYAFTTKVNADIKNLFGECGRQRIKRGLYKIHDADSSLHWSGIIGNYFEQHSGRIIPFGYDWVGRQYAIYVSKNDMILMFDPATAEVSELNQNLISFHNKDLVDDLDSFLSENISIPSFHQWV
ncbi:MAG TPA: hypothetical protein VEB86_00095 [Chryseosolibacter sp.]|nr:hypothetical protein [Chryseosolibacter sp.]